MWANSGSESHPWSLGGGVYHSKGREWRWLVVSDAGGGGRGVRCATHLSPFSLDGVFLEGRVASKLGPKTKM